MSLPVRRNTLAEQLSWQDLCLQRSKRRGRTSKHVLQVQNGPKLPECSQIPPSCAQNLGGIAAAIPDVNDGNT